MKIKQVALPFESSELEPFLSKVSVDLHYSKHHKGYIDKLQQLIDETEYENLSLEEIILKSAFANGQSPEKKMFNNASQAWNHDFFWQCLSRDHEQRPSFDFARQLKLSFSSTRIFMERFSQAGVDLFGSGWVWLVKDPQGALEILVGLNAENPLTHGKTALLACDMWEHACYLDFKNDRSLYLKNFWHLVDWKFVEKCNAEAITVVEDEK